MTAFDPLAFGSGFSGGAEAGEPPIVSLELFEFLPSSRLIVLLPGVMSFSAVQLYSAWKRWVRASDRAKHPPAFRAVGGDALGGGISIPAYYFLLNGWRVRPMEADHTLTITGNLFVDGGGDPVVSTLGAYNVLVKSVVPVQAQAVSTSGGSGPSAADIAAQVRSALAADLGRLAQIQTKVDAAL